MTVIHDNSTSGVAGCVRGEAEVSTIELMRLIFALHEDLVSPNVLHVFVPDDADHRVRLTGLCKVCREFSGLQQVNQNSIDMSLAE